MFIDSVSGSHPSVRVLYLHDQSGRSVLAAFGMCTGLSTSPYVRQRTDPPVDVVLSPAFTTTRPPAPLTPEPTRMLTLPPVPSPVLSPLWIAIEPELPEDDALGHAVEC